MKTLPVIAALSHALRSTADNLGFAFHVSWPWMLALLPVNVAGNLYALANGLETATELDPKILAVVILLALANMAAFASIAVSWHRYILLDEIPRGLQRLRFDGTVLRYAGNGLLIGIILAVGALGFVLLLTFLGFVFNAILGQFGMFLVFVPGIVILIAGMISAGYRLSTKLPAIALGRRDYTIGKAWSDTQGNVMRFLGLAILFFLIIVALGLAVAAIVYVLEQSGGSIGISVSIAIQLVVNWAATILSVTILTSLYGFFAENREF